MGNDDLGPVEAARGFGDFGVIEKEFHSGNLHPGVHPVVLEPQGARGLVISWSGRYQPPTGV